MTRRELLSAAVAAPALAQTPRQATKTLTLHLPLPGGDIAAPNAIRMERDQQGSLAILVRTDARSEPLRLLVPPSTLAPGTEHDLVLRLAVPKLELFVDGVLVDEEWPHGSVALPLGALSGDAKVWDRALSDDEVQQLFRTKASPVPPPKHVQYFRPPGHNTSAGDAMPFFDGERFHIYYLFDRRHHRSKWGLGAHQWAHMSSRDLRTWEHHPLALPITEEFEASICTGSVFRDRDTWYAFYATRQLDGSERLGVATSSDGIRFRKQIPTPFEEPRPPYRRGANRDPFVFRGADGRYRMLVTAELEKPPYPGRHGVLQQLVSQDLRTWTPAPPFYWPSYAGAPPECPDLFEWNGWHYLLFGHDGWTHYRMAKSDAGPWVVPEVDVLDSPQCRVMKTAAFHGGRRIGVGFIPEGGWGGNLVIREIVQRPDGTLGTRVPAEIGPAPAGSTGRVLRVESGGGFRAVAAGQIPRNCGIHVHLTPTPGTTAFGVVVRGAAAFAGGMELRFTPSRGRAEWRPALQSLTKESPLTAIHGLANLHRGVTLDITTFGDIFDVTIDGDRTLIHRAAGFDGSEFFVWCESGSVTASPMAVRPVTNVP